MKNKRKGQATLELSVAIICLILLFVATVKIFLWLNKTMVTRQGDYERGVTGRVQASNSNATEPVQVNETQYQPLDLGL